MLPVGTKLLVVCPIQLSEDEHWPEGTQCEIVSVKDNPRPDDGFGALCLEVAGPNGSVGSFAEIDVAGEHAWFRAIPS